MVVTSILSCILQTVAVKLAYSSAKGERIINVLLSSSLLLLLITLLLTLSS